jgi:hypothetical protein
VKDEKAMRKRRSEMDEIFDRYAKVPPVGKARRQELDEILSGYADVLAGPGLDSAQERAFLEKYAKDEEVLSMLRGARAVKGLFEAFGEFPDYLVAQKGPRRGKRHSKHG